MTDQAFSAPRKQFDQGSRALLLHQIAVYWSVSNVRENEEAKMHGHGSSPSTAHNMARVGHVIPIYLDEFQR